MYARLFFMQLQHKQLTGLHALYEPFWALLHELSGFRGALLLVNRNTGQSLTILCWESGAELQASERQHAYQQWLSELQTVLVGTPTRAVYEVSAHVLSQLNPSYSHKGEKLMSAETNKNIVRRFIAEGINRMNLSAFDELVATDVDFDAPLGLPRSREGWKQNRLMLHQGFPDAQWTEEELIAEGDTVAGRWTLRATHTGPFIGIPPTGKAVCVSGTAILHLAGGQIVKQRMNNDDFGMMMQLGVVPPPGQSKG